MPDNQFELGTVGWVYLLAVAAPATAQQATTEASIIPDEVITIIAHKQARSVAEVAGTVSVISDAEMQQNLVLTASDLIRYEMGVDLDQSSQRFGYSGFQIRGIGGNRTAIVVDQVPIADRFAVGSFSDTGRGLLDLGLANRVEILRGPASTLYGSDALGGVVAIHTLEPADVLTSAQRGTRLRLGYGSASAQGYGRVATAFTEGDHSLLIAAAALRQSETDAEGATVLDPQSLHRQGVLLKWQVATDAGQWQFSFDALQEQRETNVLHSLGSGRQRSTTQLNGDDEREEWRAILRFTAAESWIADRGEWRLFMQDSGTQQDSYEERGALAEPLSIYRGFRYDYQNYGIAADLESDHSGLGLRQRVGYGFEITRAEVWDERNALQFNEVTQVSTNILLGETFPLRDFPRTQITDFGIYLHNEIKLWSQGPVLSPGIRYEQYSLKTQADLLFSERYPNTQISDLTHSAWLPKLGLLWPLQSRAEWFAQYARGYRAPPFADVNVGLYYPQFGVLAITNPELKPERGYTFETGYRWRSSVSELAITAFHNRYSDFIQSRAPLGFDPTRQLLIFQSINRDQVVIEGIEAAWQQHWNREWSTNMWFTLTRSEDRDSGQAVPSLSPATAYAELSYAAPAGNWESRWLIRAERGQSDQQNADGDALFAAPGYATFDWLLSWYPSTNLQIGLGAFNIFDRQYWNAAHVGNYPSDDPVISILAQPGFHIKATMNYRF